MKGSQGAVTPSLMVTAEVGPLAGVTRSVMNLATAVLTSSPVPAAIQVTCVLYIERDQLDYNGV